MDVITPEFPNFGPIDQAVRESNANRIFTGGVRINNGWYRTDEEERQRREAIRSTPLP